jgi:hypothetical protein
MRLVIAFIPHRRKSARYAYISVATFAPQPAPVRPLAPQYPRSQLVLGLSSIEGDEPLDNLLGLTAAGLSSKQALTSHIGS